MKTIQTQKWQADWSVATSGDYDNAYGWHVHNGDDAEPPICEIPNEDRLDGLTRGQIARLIAAAPDLLAACEAAAEYLDHPEGGSPSGLRYISVSAILQAAIARAKGGAA